MWKGSNYGGELELGGMRDILRVAHALLEKKGPGDQQGSPSSSSTIEVDPQSNSNTAIPSGDNGKAL